MAEAIVGRVPGDKDFCWSDRSRVFRVRSERAFHFTGAIAKNAVESEDLGGLEGNRIRITGITVVSKQNLKWRVHLFSKSTQEDADINVDSHIAKVDLDSPHYGRIVYT